MYIEGTERRGKDVSSYWMALREKRRYWNLNEVALYIEMCRELAVEGIIYVPVLREII